VGRPLLVGWSYGGVLAWHWADRNPDRVLGVVCVDAFPAGLTGEAARERVRKLFRGWRLLLPIAARLGMAARMSADQHADVNIELNEISAASVPVLERLTCPVRFVLATGDSLGTQRGEMEQARTTLDSALARNPNLKVSAKVSSNHTKILSKDSPAVAQAVRELVGTPGHAVG
jgi:pimeloyl-ACP methyl ester carboxylesterase